MSTAVSTDLLDRPGARITFDVRGSGPLLVLAGSPMGAEPFGPLASSFAGDHTVVTFDPRGTGRSVAGDPDAGSPVPVRAADLAALVEHVGAGAPATVFGSSGGAVVALALAQERPELVGVVVAHEPPLQELLPDADERRTRTERLPRARVRSGLGALPGLGGAAHRGTGGGARAHRAARGGRERHRPAGRRRAALLPARDGRDGAVGPRPRPAPWRAGRRRDR
ncbi:alpha/beta fold hydrolase [Pseudonocardia sp. ICBG1293]|uniref:alpha/beta fold hydrolase n=1 Tax=Pseudonocardia sp. ICBG1293 TaxID=2844382 RepID=UPI001CCC58DA|nr:alpha/beta hydrolase [Pseudonocardia sp. ICBG1293]